MLVVFEATNAAVECLPCVCAAGGGAPFSCFSYSENGYHVAAAAPGGVSIWDLRKMKCFK